MEILIGVAVAAVVLAAVGYFVVRQRQQHAALPPEVQQGLAEAKTLRKQYRAEEKAHGKALSKATDDLKLLESAEGRKIASGGGVTVFERWITTPQGAGSVIGVKAEAADDTTIQKRITATRVLAVGIFALAAKKKSGGGNAYVVIEGPQVSGVATFAGDKNSTVGPKAYDLAAKINSAARAAEAAEPGRPAAIEAARQRVAAATDRSAVEATRARYATVVADLPAEHRGKHDAAGPI